MLGSNSKEVSPKDGREEFWMCSDARVCWRSQLLLLTEPRDIYLRQEDSFVSRREQSDRECPDIRARNQRKSSGKMEP